MRGGRAAIVRGTVEECKWWHPCRGDGGSPLTAGQQLRGGSVVCTALARDAAGARGPVGLWGVLGRAEDGR